MPTLKQTLSYLILGQKGGKNRMQIISLLIDRPYNLNQLADALDVNYRTVAHHIDVLVKNDIVSSSKAGGHGDVYFLTPEMESNMAMFEQITERLNSEGVNLGMFKSILEQTTDSVVIIDANDDVMFWNESSERLYGFPVEDVVGNPVKDFCDPNVYEEINRKLENEEQIRAFETPLTTKTGEEKFVSITLDLITDENDELVGYSVITKDITDRKDGEDQLKENASKYKKVLTDCCPEKVEDIEKDKGCGCPPS